MKVSQLRKRALFNSLELHFSCEEWWIRLMNHHALASDTAGSATIVMAFLMKQSVAMGPVYL